ncbi:MAG: hypothetical protein ACOH15_04245 [Acetobacterium sp.]
MKRMSILLSLLLVALVCLGCSATGEKASGNDPAFSGDAQVKVMTADGKELLIDKSIMAAEKTIVFDTTQGKSGEEIETNTHVGILLKEVLAKSGVNVESINQVKCTSMDGFSKVYSKSDLDDPDKLFLTFKMDGELLSYKDQNAFFIVAKNEKFKQNWTKYLGEIELS